MMKLDHQFVHQKKIKTEFVPNLSVKWNAFVEKRKN